MRAYRFLHKTLDKDIDMKPFFSLLIPLLFYSISLFSQRLLLIENKRLFDC